METRRLKNIVILILVILNVFLAALLVNYRLQGARARRSMLEELERLFSASAISLSEDLDLEIPAPPSLSVERDLTAEAEIAATLLGEAVAGEHQGGGIYSYTGALGTVHFRSSGNFDYVPEAPRVLEDPQGFCEDFCAAFGYLPVDTLPGSTGTFTATEYVSGSPIYNGNLTIQFQDGALAALSGSYVSTVSPTSTPTSLTAVDALVRFLDYRNAMGVVCDSIQGIMPVYELQPGPSGSLQLAAKWQITADTYQYYVDCTTGEILRA